MPVDNAVGRLPAAMVTAVIAATLIGAAVLARIWLVDLPNFKPIGAIALFAGFYFARSSIAAGIVIAAMAISDLLIGPYLWPVAFSVYICLAAPVLLGRFLRRGCGGTSHSGGKLVGSALVAAALISLLFYLLTNAAWWQFSSMYERNGNGLLQCYAAALPFFRWTLAGNLVFTAALFGLHALALRWLAGRVPTTAGAGAQSSF